MNCPHCETHIDEHEANRCLDAWVAETVMDEILTSPDTVSPHDRETGITQDVNLGLSYFCTRIQDAWQVVEKMAEGGYCVDIAHDLIAWRVLFTHADNMGLLFGADWKQSLEAQICEAALKAVGND